MLKKFIDSELNFKIGLKLFPPVDDRAFWEKAKAGSVDFFEKIREIYGDNKDKYLTATLYSQYHITGNRVDFEDIYFFRRAELLIKSYLECMYNDGRYFEDIIDLTWMILEESSWCVPAHERKTGINNYLPDFEEQTVDLFAAETAALMCFVYEALGDRLDSFSPVIKRRIKHRIDKFLFDDYLKKDDYFWQGFTGVKVNNWNPWINSNILICAINLIDDCEKLEKILRKVMKSVQIFIDTYPEDGACDEGPDYWNVAGLSMLDCLYLIDIITNGQVEYKDKEKTKNALEYFSKIYTGKTGVVNFADGRVVIPIYYATVYKYAELTGNEKMMRFAKKLRKENRFMNADVMGKMRSKTIGIKPMRLMDMATYSGKLDAVSYECEFFGDSYLKSTNVAVMREEKGFTVALKGGHNGESHNHNDIGNFIVYKNNQRFFVDTGPLIYTKASFNSDRYSLFTNRSFYHNVPLIGGYEQKPGRECCAKDVSFTSGEKSVFSLDIKEAYENKDDISKWVRTVTLDKKSSTVTVTENFEFEKEMPYELHFVSTCVYEEINDGISFTATNSERLEMNFDKSKFSVQYEKIPITDDYLRMDWGNFLYLIILKSKAKADKITYVLK